MYSEKDTIFDALMAGNKNNVNPARQMLGLSYHPVQNANWNNIYDAQTALVRGTIFPELDLPYTGKGRTAR